MARCEEGEFVIDAGAPAAVRDSYGQAEALARARMPHLYRVARLFPDPERYAAFCATYASMRWIDDCVDGGEMTPDELRHFRSEIDAAFAGRVVQNPFTVALAHTLSRFDLPQEPWHRLFAAMHHDLERRGFRNYEEFRNYAEGATVAPAAVFAALLLMRESQDRRQTKRPYAEIRDAVRAAAIACYETHILRDAQEDLEAGTNYFPQDELATYRLDPAKGLNASWRPYLRAYGMRIRGGWQPALAQLRTIEPDMSPRERLMLHLLVEFYGFSLQKIIRLDYDLWSGRHWPELGEVEALLATLSQQYEPGVDLSHLVARMVEDV
jgi:phytoene synthase